MDVNRVNNLIKLTLGHTCFICIMWAVSCDLVLALLVLVNNEYYAFSFFSDKYITKQYALSLNIGNDKMVVLLIS